MNLRIREVREKQGMTITELANAMQTSIAYIYAVDSYKTSPSIRGLEKFAKALNVRVVDLIDLEL